MHQPAPDQFFYFWLALCYCPERCDRLVRGENAELNRCCHALKQVIILHTEHFILLLSQCVFFLIKKKIMKSRTCTILFIFLCVRWKHSWWLLFHKIPHNQPTNRALKSQRVNLVSSQYTSVYLHQGQSSVCLMDTLSDSQNMAKWPLPADVCLFCPQWNNQKVLLLEFIALLSLRPIKKDQYDKISSPPC